MEALVGRVSEVALLSGLAAQVAAGRGGVVVVEGEPGIGKTALVGAGVAEARRLGCGVVRGAGDELLGRFPLRVLLDAFDIRPGSSDERRRGVAEVFWAGSSGGLSGDPVVAAAEELVALVERLCADGPLVVAVDDLHWVDGASLAVWVRLAGLTEQVPLLLLGACRTVPYRAELEEVRQVAEARGRRVGLGPLAVGEVARLVGRLAGGVPDEGLLAAVQAASGNPLWVNETVTALRHEDSIRLGDGRAVLSDVSYRAPVSLLAAVGQRLTFLSPAAADVVRLAALLGGAFSVADVAVVGGRRPSDLMGSVGEASAAGVLGEVDGRLGFRHPLIRQALYEQVPGPVRSAMHRDAARALAQAGAPIGSVAAQLLAAGGPVDAWRIEWLARNGLALVHESRQVAVELLQAAAESGRGLVGDEQYWQVASVLARGLSLGGRYEESRVWARRVLQEVADPDRAAEMCVVLASPAPGWRVEDALAVVQEGLIRPDLSPQWRARLVAHYAILALRLGDVEEAEAWAWKALALGEAAGDAYSMGLAMNTLAGASEHRGDYEVALGFLQRLIDAVGDDPESRSVRIGGYINLALALMQLDRGEEADEMFRTARDLARRLGIGEVATVALGTGVSLALGRWDDVIAELDFEGELDAGSAVVLFGVGGLIAAHRDERREALAHLGHTQGINDIVNSTFVLAAGALLAEQDGDVRGALSQLGVIVRPEYSAMSDRYELFPDLVRLALAAGDDSAAREAVVTAEAEAVRVRVPGSGFAAMHCRGLSGGDPAPVLVAADYYRSCGRLPLLGNALEDAAVLLAAGGRTTEAHSAAGEAEQIYMGLGAVWDLRRMAARLRPSGIRLGVRGPRRRPDSGWEALTPTEVAVARLVAEGLSNPDIAVKLLLSRRTVQTHVSHILAKLGARARLEIAHHAASNAS